jgi:hypothetical protein
MKTQKAYDWAFETDTIEQDIKSKIDISKLELQSIWSEIDRIERKLKEINAKFKRIQEGLK